MSTDYLSTFRIPLERMGNAKNRKVGDRFPITAHVELTGINKERHYPLDEKGRLAEKSKFKTMMELKVCDVDTKSQALKKRLK